MMRFFGWLISLFAKPCVHEWERIYRYGNLLPGAKRWVRCRRCGLETNDPRPVGK